MGLGGGVNRTRGGVNCHNPPPVAMAGKQLECHLKGLTRFAWINVAAAAWLGMFIYAQTQPISDTVHNLSYTHLCCGRDYDHSEDSPSLCARRPDYWIINPLRGFVILNIAATIPAVVYPHHTRAWFAFTGKDPCEDSADAFTDGVRFLYCALVASAFVVASVVFFRAANTVCPVPINGTYISKFYEAQPVEAAGISIMVAILWSAIAILVGGGIVAGTNWFIRTYWCDCKNVDRPTPAVAHGAEPVPPSYQKSSAC